MKIHCICMPKVMVRLHGVSGLGMYIKRAMMRFVGLFWHVRFSTLHASPRAWPSSVLYHMCTPDDALVWHCFRTQVGRLSEQ